MRQTLSILLIALFLTGCQATLNPYTKQLTELNQIYSESKISPDNYIKYKMELTEKEQQWEKGYYDNWKESAQKLEDDRKYQEEMRLKYFEASQSDQPVNVKIVQ